MRYGRLAGVGLWMVLALVLPACGGGGGDGGGDAGIRLTAVEVTTQNPGPQSPFGSTLGGDAVILRGTGFVNGATVSFGSSVGTVTQVATGEIRVTTPARREGLADITITNPDGASSTFDDRFRFIAPPEVVSMAILTGPTQGGTQVPIAGGESVQLNGNHFRDGMTARVDGRNVPVTIVDDSTATFTAPTVGDEQALDVVLTGPEGLVTTYVRGLDYTAEFSLERATANFSAARARHLFRRAAFGATPARVDEAVTDGLETTIDKLMRFSNDSNVEAQALPLWGTNAPPFAPYNNRVARQWWSHMMLKNPNPFQERLAWFLHDHFATSNINFSGDAQFYFYYHVNLFRRFGLAASDQTGDGQPGLAYSWRDLLVAVSKDRAMLEWLDGRRSVRGNPNENFARELWELFMLGEGNGYTEEDIQEAAKALTGFNWFRNEAVYGDRRLEIRYEPERHDERSKTILGETGFFGYDDIAPFHYTRATGEFDPTITTDTRDTDGGVVDLTLRMRPTESSEFICRKLAAFFLYENPHDVVVQALAEELRQNNWNLEPVIETILESKAMYSGRARKGQVRTPVEFVFSFMRTTEVDLHPVIGTNTVRIVNELSSLGQMVLQPPDVNGWPVGSAWLSSQAMLERANFITFAIEQLDDFDTQIAPLLPPAGQRSPAQLVDHLSTILDVKLSGNARTKLIEYVTTQEQGGQTVPFAYDQNNENHVKMKTRGLIFAIAQYHDAHQN